MKAILLHGSSHGSLLHSVPAHLPDWYNRQGERYFFVQPFTSSPHVALYANGKPCLKKNHEVLNSWKRLLDDPGLFTAAANFKRKKYSRK